MKIAFVMDPFDSINTEKDTTYHLIGAASQLHFECFYISPDNLRLENDKVFAKGQRLKWHDTGLSGEDPQDLCLDDFQSLWVRTDPPFDRRYLYVTYFLDFLPPSCLCVNSSKTLKEWNEKLVTHKFQKYMVDSLVSKDQDQLKKFVHDQKRTTLKPIDGFGGKGIDFTDSNDPDLKNKLRKITNEGKHFAIAQAYIEEAKEGDKRVLIWNGKILGAILRLHADGVELNNLDAGGKALPTLLTERQSMISKEIAEYSRANGVYFVGIDFLGDYLVEINHTSPTGLQELCRFENKEFHIEIMRDLKEITSNL
ncbi:MAG: glutathione synthase [Bdellovibrionales bacterium]